MPKHDLPIIAIIQTLDTGAYLAEALFFPKVARYSDKVSKTRESLKANLKKLVEEMPLTALSQRFPAQEPEISEIEITLDPPSHSSAWRKPVNLNFQILQWSHGESAQIAYIPALNIEVVATSPPTRAGLHKLIRQHIRAALGRADALNSLGNLVQLQRCRELTIEHKSIEVSLPTPKQIALSDRESEENKQSVLAVAGTDLTKEMLPAAYEMPEVVEQIAEALTGRTSSSVLVVGRSGVGKTAAIYELVRRRADFQLGHTPFWETNGSRLVAGMSGFGQWQERCRKLWREAAQTRAILYLGNLIELMEVGKSIASSLGIAGFLQPYIARGDVLAIAECTPEQLSMIERTESRLLEAFHQIRIEEATPEQSRNILLSVALAQNNESGTQPGIELDGIERIDQLHRRYASYSATPGRPVRFLKNLLRDNLPVESPQGSLTAAEVTAAFSRETGLPLVLLDEGEKLDLESARAWFSSRVIGQPDAVDLIVDLLATVKAELTRPRRPIASLLFIGPTGVGKTEMSKSLAEFLFRDRQRMVRFDMSEYADPIAVNRLIGGSFSSEGLLTAKVREQPFAVVLFDEFEKAHPLFFDLLLQVLGEGRLTDGMGRVADFSNAVVIMTSNLGAESFQRGLVGFGQAETTRRAAGKHFMTAVRQALRPEMFNRIDCIVPFAPLDEKTVLLIAEREIERIKKRDGIYYRGVTLNIREGVTEYFARRGYDARYGARPLKRVIEREMLVPLSEELNQQQHDAALTINVWIENERLKFNARPSFDDSGKQVHTQIIDRSVADLARQYIYLRRDARRLESSSIVLNLRNEIFTIERSELRLAKQKWKNPTDLERISELPKLRSALQEIHDFAAKITRLENEAVLMVYGKAKKKYNDLGSQLVAAQNEWNKLLISTYSLRFKNPDLITIAIFSEVPNVLYTLAGAYYKLAVKQGAVPEADQFILKRNERGKKTSPGPGFERKRVEKIESFLAAPGEAVIGIVLGINAPFARPLFDAERGLHLFIREKKSSKCLVQTSGSTISEYNPPEGIERHGAIGHQERRRSYHLDQSLIDDAIVKRQSPWSGRAIDQAIGQLIEESLMVQARALIDGYFQHPAPHPR